jgi:hypothetical protein
MKVFGIGLNKTGTTTLGVCFRILGFDHMGCRPDLLVDLRKGRISRVFNEIDKHEAFEDWPYPLMYRALWARYGPDAKFVLTMRRSGETWLQSLKLHSLATAPDRHCRLLAYGHAYPFGAEREHLEFYERHLCEVRWFFRAHNAEDRFCEICWETGDGWEKLCAFLNLPPPETAFPHENKSSERRADRRVLAQNLRRIREQIGLLNPELSDDDLGRAVRDALPETFRDVAF